MKMDMYLITQDFPYGYSEDTFVKPEYPYLCDRFHVSVIAAEVGEVKNPNPQIEAYIIPTSQCLWDKILSLFRFFCEKDCYIEMAAILKDRRQVLKRIYRMLMFGAAAETFYRRLKKKTGLNQNTYALFYFYWFDYKCFGLTMHRHKFPNIKIIARTHGYDLYDYRELYGRQFFKPQTDAGLERLIFAAQFAKDYYLERYNKKDGKKYPLCRLGVTDKGMTTTIRKAICKDDFLLLSCSNTACFKRIELIIDGLSVIADKKIKWVHIGGGDELANLEKTAWEKLQGKDNIQYEFMGMMPNEAVIRFYREQYVSCFITMTATEGGSPVSVQEALSFGVPVIATAVGELPRMVSDNGILLPKNPTESEVGHAIAHMTGIYGTEEYFGMCEQSLQIFKDKFDAERNFGALAKELIQIMD
ncbi:MAG: glycosyltransferase [Bacillus sp. (in: Bacteria)]|nr:glycosyltransferase [Bacillus sp. (in: firmicutes)]MCM1425507.1 glycosyltransferase [Eubacterium sp.]